MKREKEKIDVVFLGRFNDSDILSGPEKTANRIFCEHSKLYKSCFIQYFFDGNKYGISKKLFGKEGSKHLNGSQVLTLGLFKIITELIIRKPEIIHIITYERFAVLALVSKLLFKSRIIYNIHGIIAYENSELKKTALFLKLKDRICEKLLLKYSDVLIFYSENSIDIAEKYFKIDESKAVILSGGIDEEFCSQKNTSSLQKEGNLKIVIQYLNVLKQSSAEYLKEVLNKLTFPIELYVIGENNGLFSDTDSKITVNYIDKLDSELLAEFYKDKDIFLSLNKYDTFSISTAEAMAAGLVPVVTEETGISRYIENGENGFTVKFGDTEKLAQILNYLNNDSDMLREISKNTCTIGEILSWHDVYDTYKNIYLSITK